MSKQNDIPVAVLSYKASQDKHFLQRVKGRKVYYFDDFYKRKYQVIAEFSEDGKILSIPDLWDVPLKRTLTHYCAIYQIDFNFQNFYIGIFFHHSVTFIYSTSHYDDLFKRNGRHIILTKGCVKGL